MSDNLFVTDYNVVELNDTAFDVPDDRFARVPSKFLSFCGKNSLFLTQKIVKSRSESGRGRNLPITCSPSSSSKKILGGFDGGVEIGWYGDWAPDVFDALCCRLERCRQAADDKDIVNAYTRIGRYVVQLAPSGARVGRVLYKFVLLYHGLRIYIHSNPTGNIQPVRVKIGAVPLMRHGLQRVYQLIIDILFSLGFNPIDELVSRADCQVMTWAVTVQEFFESISGGRFVSLSRGKMSLVASLKTGSLESITVSSRNVELCVYDKLAELPTCDQTYQDAFMQAYSVDGNLPQVLTRFEFRFRAEILRNFGIKTVSDLVACSASLLRWASSEWFRVLCEPKVRGTENRAKIAPIWQEVQKLYHRTFAVFGCQSIQRLRSAVAATKERAVRLVRQAVGCLGSAVALVADSFRAAKEQFYDLAVSLLDQNFERLRTKTQSRAVELALVDGYYNKE